MTEARPAQRIEWIPIERITVVNPRVRNKRVFREIVANIAQIGLKRPVTVTRRAEADGPFYDLVCGQGRLEAYLELGQKEVPALVVTADVEDCLIASLVENCARRQHNAIDLLNDIAGMKTRGYSAAEIARKTGLSSEYVHGVTRLLEKGEHRLLMAVESKNLPISVAIEIADADDHGVQRALHDAYERGLLKGKRLLAAKKLVEDRRRRGKHLRSSISQASKMSSGALVKAYKEDVDRKNDLVRRATGAHDKLILIVEAVRRLHSDEEFTGLLEDEGLSTLPAELGRRVDSERPAA